MPKKTVLDYTYVYNCLNIQNPKQTLIDSNILHLYKCLNMQIYIKASVGLYYAILVQIFK